MKKLSILLLLSLFSYASLWSQNSERVLKGKVTDIETGKGIQGVAIKIAGSTLGTVTSENGDFSLKVPTSVSKPNLEVSAVGFAKQSIIPAGGELRISLKKETQSLEEVVVVGYGTQKKKNITGAVTSFDTKSIEEKPIARIDQAMIGQMPGVQVRQQTGMPGSGFSILVRGTGSISAGTEPLYVVDGFPLDVVSQNAAGSFTGNNPLNNLNPSDIESIQVLKDAAAAAIYGSRASNGVVVITTKRGHLGKGKISVNAYTGTSQVAKKMDVLTPDEWINEATELENYKWVNSAATGRTADQTNAQRRTILGLAANAYNVSYMPDDRWSMPGHPGLEYVNWQDSVFQKAPFQNYEISASGGSDAVRYFVSGNYLDQNGVLLKTGYKNYSARANVEVTPSKNFKIGINLAPSYSETNAPLAEGKDNQLHHIFGMIPVVEDTAGMLSGAGKNSIYGWASSNVSPVAYLNNTIGLTKINRILSLYMGSIKF